MYSYPQLSTSEMVKKIDQLQAWQSFLNYPIRLGETFTNPLRHDNHPKAFLKPYEGCIFLTDFAHPQFNSYTVFHAFGHRHHISYRAAVQLIYNHQQYGTPLNVEPPQIKTGYVKPLSIGRAEIIIEPFLYNGQPAYTEKDKEYWSQRGITIKDLQNPKQPCFSVHHYYINGICVYPKSYPCYAFTFPESQHIKIYCPGAFRKFPASNTTTTDVWKWLSFPVPSVAIITKSYKDGSMINKMGFDVDIYAFQNEGVIDQDTVDYINETYDMVLIIYDNDQAGMKASRLLKERITVACKRLFYPIELGKDTDDMIMNGHREIAYNLIANELPSRQPIHFQGGGSDHPQEDQTDQPHLLHH